MRLLTAKSGIVFELNNFLPFLEGLPKEIAHFVRESVLPVIVEGKRASLIKSLFWDPRTRILTLESPVGRYRFFFTDDAAAEYPRNGHPQTRLRNGRLRGHLIIPFSTIVPKAERWQYRLRSLLSPDPYFDPHLLPPGWTLAQATPSYLQQDGLSGLMELDNLNAAPVLKRALIEAPGSGKTLLLLWFVKQYGNFEARHKSVWKHPPKLLVTIENNDVLKSIAKAVPQILKTDNIAHLYDRKKNYRTRFLPTHQVVLASRSMYEMNYREIHDVIEKDIANGQPWIVAVDEAQHRGRKGGQYETIFAHLEPHLGEYCRLVDLSATYWHRNFGSLVTKVNGNVFGGNLEVAEQKLLRAGEKPGELARTQFFRTAEQGYLAPIHGLHLVRKVGKQSAMDLVDDTVKLNPDGSVKKVKVPESLMKDLLNRAQKMRLPGMPDRAIIIVPSIAHANAYAYWFAANVDGEARAYHRGEDADADSLDWFNDENDYASAAESAKHKYIFVVRLLNEGTDTPKANMVVLLKRYPEDVYGFGLMLQNIARGDRVAALKLAWRILDYGLRSRSLIEGLLQIMVEGGTAPSLEPGEADEPGPPTGIFVDELNLTPTEFRARFYEFFPEDGGFDKIYPFFNHQTFMQGAWQAVRDHTTEMGVRNVQQDVFATRGMVEWLLERFPDIPQKQDLIDSLLSDDAGWGGADGSTIDSGKGGKAEQLFFGALYEMGHVLHAYGLVPDLKLESLDRYEEFEKIFNFLCPDVRSIRTLKVAEDFLDERIGSFELVLEEARRWGILNPTYTGGLVDFLTRLLARLPDSPEKQRLQWELFGGNFWQWSSGNDGVRDKAVPIARATDYDDPRSLRRSLQRNYQRLYRALFRIAYLTNKAYPNTVNLDRIHLRSELLKLLKVLREETATTAEISSSSVDRFVDPMTGARVAILERNLHFSDRPFARNYGMRELVYAMVENVSDEEEKIALLTDFKNESHWLWRHDDGAKLTQASLNRTRLFARACHTIAKVERKHGLVWEDGKVDTYEGMTQLFDWLLFGRRLRLLPLADINKILAENDYIDLLQEEAHARGFTNLSNDFGLQRLAIAVAEGLPDCEAREQLITSFQDQRRWGWLATDFNMLKFNRMPDIWRKIDRAFQVAAQVGKECQASFPVNSRYVDRLSTLRKFFLHTRGDAAL